jgi:hypothetical protein
MINLPLLAHALFVLAFDYLPDRMSSAIAGALALGYATVVALEWLRRQNLDLAPMLFPIGMILLCWSVAALHWQVEPTDFPPDMVYAARQISVFVSFLAFMAARARISPIVLGVVIIALALSAVVHATLMPKVFLNSSLRLAPFSGGLHTSGYLTVAAILATVALRKNGTWSRRTAAVILGILLAVLAGNAVRTPLFGLVAFAAGAWISSSELSPRLRLLLRMSAVYGVCCVVVLLFVVDLRDFDQMSSGRLSTYFERFDILSSRGLVSMLFGTGPGTDLLRTQTWWWDYKDSHSDLLKYLWEGGAVGLAALLVWMLQIATYRRGRLFALASVLVATSLISNAYLTRPNAIFLLFAAQAFALASRERKLVEARAANRSGPPLPNGYPDLGQVLPGRI